MDLKSTYSQFSFTGRRVWDQIKKTNLTKTDKKIYT